MVIPWLLGAGLGPAAVALPVNYAAEKLAEAAQQWFKRLRHTDDLSRLVRAATGATVGLTRDEFEAVRGLLADKQTWALLGRGTIGDLAARIASCLPPGEGRTAEGSQEAAMTIARGLLEFAVADLDPKLFQQLLLARLDRMETGQGDALDEALLGLHADLVARLADQGQLDAERFTSVMAQLRRVLERLPPGAANRAEIVVYLQTVIEWLGTDPWAHDRFGGPVLTLAAIERKLQVHTATGAQDLDADELVKQCRGLVILGGPGSGKTWVAKRAARRCAQDALAALTAGAALDEVELPLYTTCSSLYSAAGDIREAAVSSALERLSDLGGSRITAALRVFFTERNAPTLLVIDALDEASGGNLRLRQVGSLPWRIVLTSRPSSWTNQLVFKEQSGSPQVCELLPLRYPDGVEPFIQRWFAERPEWGRDLAAQIARRPGLQQAATVPLILAFYCIVGGNDPLPEFGRDLYSKVLNRMLGSGWRIGDDSSGRRNDEDSEPDADSCLRTLRAWAWSGATSDIVSGVGTWADDILVGPARMGKADEHALDNVATPVGRPDDDSRKTPRRFVHRSIREHLVAEHVACLPVDQAVETLLPHIWYDADWEYAEPAALAKHPQHDQLLRDLICRAASSDQLPRDLSDIDAGWELRGLLARVASESSETDWSPEVAGIIAQARVELARSGRAGDLVGAAQWVTSNRHASGVLLGLLPDEAGGHAASTEVVNAVVQLALTAEDKRTARDSLLELLRGDIFNNDDVVNAVVQLAPTAEDKRAVRDSLLGLLADETRGWVAGALVGGVVQLDPTAQDKRQARDALLRLLVSETNHSMAAQLADQVTQLDPTADDERKAREAMLGLLHGIDEYWEDQGRLARELAATLALLDPTTDDKRSAREALLGLLAGGFSRERGLGAYDLAGAVVELAVTAEDKRQARDALLGLLADPTEAASSLVGGVIQLAATAEDKRQARDALLRLLAGPTAAAAWVGSGIVELDPTADEKRQAREALLELLASQTDGWTAAELADGVARLDPTTDEKRQVREALLGLLDGQARPGAKELAGLIGWPVTTRLADGVVQLDPTAEDRRRAREALLELLASQTDGWTAAELDDRVVELAPTAEDKRQAREALFGLLARATDRGTAALAAGVAQLDPTSEERRQAREVLLGFLAGDVGHLNAEDLVGRLVQLAPTAEDKRQAREGLLGLLARATDGWVAKRLADGVVQLAPTAEDKHQARQGLLALLTRATDGGTAVQLVGGVVQLDPTAEEKQQAREALLAFLASEIETYWAEHLVGNLVRLDPTTRDLSTWHARATPPTAELLAATRRNSALPDWLAALRWLPHLA